MTATNGDFRSKIKVLFIGNSFTARNDLPGLIADLAAARGKEMTHRLISAGGVSLRMHWNKGEALEAIQSGGYDYVVLQEQSTLPIKNAKRFHENVRLFDSEINASGAKMVLYMTWARRHESHNQQILTDAYRDIGAEIGAIVVPVGEAWRTVLAETGAPILYDDDGSHPSAAGSYLAACVFYSVLFADNPSGIESSVRGVTAAERELLQGPAWLTVKA